VLERQARFQEALYLAEAEGQTDRYVALLVKLDRVSEAVAYGLEQVMQTGDALVLAQALLKHGATSEALRIAEHGLALECEHQRALPGGLGSVRARPGDCRRAHHPTWAQRVREPGCRLDCSGGGRWADRGYLGDARHHHPRDHALQGGDAASAGRA